MTFGSGIHLTKQQHENKPCFAHIGPFPADIPGLYFAKSFSIDDPESSNQQYQSGTSAPSESIRITDARTEDGKAFSKGTLDITLTEDDGEIELISFLTEHLQTELSARGLNATIADGGDILLEIERAQMLNHRTSSFSPYVTLTTFGANLKDGNDNYKIGVFIRRAKVPVWSFDEVIEPTINQPLELLVNEVAAKINALIFGQSISDEQVDKLAGRISATDDENFAYQEVYQLGFGNNPAAIPYLIKFSKDNREYVRQASISSLGILQATNQVNYLISIAKSKSSWSDRAMALKALGDLGTTESLGYLAEIRAQSKDQTTRGALWDNSIIDLYLD